MKAIDLRSDTVTKPDPGMREAMATADVGDDVFGEDPTVLRLEQKVAEILGKERALFVPSGTMGNQICVNILTTPGDEILLEKKSHIVNYESGAAGLISGVQLGSIEGSSGILRPDQIESAIRTRNEWDPLTELLCLENTHNKAGGIVQSLEEIEECCDVARKHDLALHLDGARLWNASVASGTTEARFAAAFDTVSVCLSKGLGAPVGSVIAGTNDLMTKARRIRKRLGGGMRQVGILAAAGIYAIDNNRSKLALDHEHTKTIAEALAESEYFYCDLSKVESNIIMFDVKNGDALAWVSKLQEMGILVVPFGPKTIRVTLHLGINTDDVDQVVSKVQTL